MGHLVAVALMGHTTSLPFGQILIKSEFHMSKVCVICGKKPSFGHNRSHSMRATPRRWDPNVQKVHIELNGKPTQAYVCAKCLKAHKVTKVTKVAKVAKVA
jgi:large subunit ribosomal protein L28